MVTETSSPPTESTLLSNASRQDLTDSIGTLLSDIQLSSLSPEQLDELALLVSERGVVFFRGQNLSDDQQVQLSKHYGNKGNGKADTAVHQFKEIRNVTPGQQSKWHADLSFAKNPPNFSILRIEDTTESICESSWVSQYGLYDALSDHMKTFLDSLHAVHSSKLSNESILETWSTLDIESHHPAVQTNPITGLKALNVTPGSVTGFAELKKKESDNLLEFLDYHIHSTDEEAVRFKWEAGSVAIWDNRSTAYRDISKSKTSSIATFKTLSFGAKPYFDKDSESREQREQRVAREAKEEFERLESIKARFNNTPMRRLIQRQVAGQKEIRYADSGYGGESSSKADSNSPITNEDKSSENRPFADLNPNSESRTLRTQQWANGVAPKEEVPSVTEDLKVQKIVSQIPEVKFNVTPLRRIIQRQISGSSSGLKCRDWR
ncbi:TauD-domain-containing protein [Aaosphaeria arxii CBS 175.79]|uniref:TauD-domain-containing protein n=1 Tax=Aaosphaeria arxii CBS 175.79 TaxID=1450172 RepID=A0A6A5XSJ6_9PLEO|nr:TauD-domain-containing protein [Aaosphaeria arxii CBS 175.79]KAF2015224.1 TauD-domain-containing protein [Aaosphaeria arxii CBS 175.79]